MLQRAATACTHRFAVVRPAAVHAAGTSVETLTGECLARLLRTAADIGHDRAMRKSVPSKVITPAARAACAP